MGCNLTLGTFRSETEDEDHKPNAQFVVSVAQYRGRSVFFTGPAYASLIAHYSFNSDFTDESGNANHLTGGFGTPRISTTAGEFALGGGALDLDSTTSNKEYLKLTTPITFGAGDPWSVAFWARHRPGNDGRAGMIVGDLTSTDFIWIPRDGVVDGIRFRSSSGENADYNIDVQPAGVFHHWALIADGVGSIEVYYDNASLGAQSSDTTLTITSVGHAFNSAVHSMNGQIDELYLYDDAIDAAKINTLFLRVPEPNTLILLGSGCLILLFRRRSPVLKVDG